jgi:exopolysaccharide production protein ExoQ
MARFGAQFFVFVGLFIAFRVDGYKFVPALAPLALMLGTIPILVLAPTKVTRRLPVSLLILLLVGWELASVLWTDSPEGTASGLLREVPIVVGFVIVTGLISLKALVPALLWSIRVSILFTIAVLILDPRTRFHFDPSALVEDVSGWHGYFPHKNVMAPYLVFGMLTILTFDRTKLLRPLSLIAIVVLLVGSDSVTGQTSALLAVSVWIWVQLYRNLDLRNSSIFLISSLSVAGFGALGIAASLTTLIGASGKDVTFTGRTFIWAATSDAWSQRPLTGYGLAGILGSEPITAKTAEVWRAIGFRVPHAHNGILDIGIQLGIVGVVLFLALFITTMADGFSMLRDRPKLAAWIVSMMVVQIYMSISENVLLGNGWFSVLVMFRLLLMHQDALEFDDGVQLADRLRRTPRRV